MGVVTNTAAVGYAVRTFFNRGLLSVARPRTIYSRIAERFPLSKRNGDTMIFRRYERLGIKKQPLIEGVPPTGSKLTKTDVSARIQGYGDYVTLTDLIMATMDSPILQQSTKRLAQGAAESIDSLLADVVTASTQVVYGGGVASRSLVATTAQKIDVPAIDRAVRLLWDNDAMMYTKMVSSSVRQNTYNIRPAFWGITHPDVQFTIQDLPGFVSVEEYGSQGPVMEAEFGAIKNVRFLSTTLAKFFPDGGGNIVGSDVKSTTGTLADVYTTVICAEDAVGSVPLDGMSLETIIKPIGSAGSGDPLNQIGTQAWKHYGANLILNPNWLVRIETTAGDDNP